MPPQPTAPPPIRGQAVYVKPTWVETTMVIRRASGRVDTADGFAYGTLVVHATLAGEASAGYAPITVTHQPSQLAVVRVDSTEDAVAIAERLWDRCRDALCMPGEDVDKSKVPADVVAWIKRCNAERKLCAF